MKMIPSPRLGFIRGVFLANHLASNDNLTNTAKRQKTYRQKLTSCAGGRQNTPRPLQVNLWPVDLESDVQVTCDVGYLCANFGLPDQTSDAHHRL